MVFYFSCRVSANVARFWGGASRQGARWAKSKLNLKDLRRERERVGQGKTGEWWPGTGLNRRRRPFQGRALPLSYLASVQTWSCNFLRGMPEDPA